MKHRPSRIGPQVAWGTVLIVICLILIVLWNVVIVRDYFHLQEYEQIGPGHWWILAIGLALFITVLVGLITFMVNLIKQIRTNQAQSNFIDAVTHELKTPLTSLKLHLQSLQMGRVPQDRQAEFHRILLADVERLDLLVDHVLEAARLDHGPLTKAPFSLHAEIQAAIRTVYQRHPQAECAFQLEGPDAIIASDSKALQLVLVNLLDNAVKYSEPGSPVRISLESQGNRIQIAVRDHGIGIAEDQQKRIFQRFYRSGNELTRTRPGTGLGLYIVKETIRRLGGRIRVTSPGEGQGSTFWITLPGGDPCPAS